MNLSRRGWSGSRIPLRRKTAPDTHPPRVIERVQHDNCNGQVQEEIEQPGVSTQPCFNQQARQTPPPGSACCPGNRQIAESRWCIYWDAHGPCLSCSGVSSVTVTPLALIALA